MIILNRKSNKYSLLTMLAIVTCVLTGCAGKDPFATNVNDIKKAKQNENVDYIDEADNGLLEKTEALDDNLIVVGVSQLGSESAWRTANTESVQKALTSDNGFFMIYNNARQRQENQIKAIRSFISQRVDYIVFAPVIEEGWGTVLMEAKDAGIPVILMDRAISKRDDDLYTTRVGTDAKAEGEKAGRWLEDELKKQGRDDEEINIVVLQGTIGSSSQRGRTMGFDIISDSHSNWNILTQVDGDFTTSKGKEVMEQILNVYSDIDVVVCQNDDMAMGALEALDKAGFSTGINGGVIIISFDATKEALELVKKGIINVDIECNPNQGEYISDVIKRLEAGEEVEKIYIVDENVFTIENVDSFIEDRTY